MPLFSKHRDILYSADGTELRPDAVKVGETVRGFSNPTGKPNRRPLALVVTDDGRGGKRFTLKGWIS